MGEFNLSSTEPTFDIDEHEAGQRRLLRRNRSLATGLLLFAASLFVALRFVPDPGFWILLLRAASEAAIVGALADWFAVTALFRRPLGLPIPHTAIIPSNKDRIGDGLGGFVERNFLEPSLVVAKLRSVDPAARLVRWLNAPGMAEALAARLAASLPSLIHSIEDRELRVFFGRALGEQLRGTEVAPLIGKVLGVLVASGQHQPLLERAVGWAIDLVERNQGRLETMVGQRSGWWIPKAIDRRVARQLSQGAHDYLSELLDPASPLRIRMELAVEDLARDLQEDADTRAQVEDAKSRLLDRPEIQAWLGGLWDEVRRITLDDLERPDGRTREAVTTALRSLGAALEADPAMRARLNASVERLALDLITPWRRGIGRFIAEVVHGWDAGTVSDRIEMAVGSDLQYVRISGTIVAALVGSVLFLVTRLIE
ncbi:membrane protein [Skermanella stibiiresistens SB22]|uniref:Membrane protein n=1 Tax=Skermanella stibiiresistens SB22 TaxID=1385369 RepID=W9GTP2_9PROT|nr:DUF445 domain-containing protein [Skermanella stibiiresistens]EWY37260.1 membrane protein [Skermanella stibiiresistens SB22]